MYIRVDYRLEVELLARMAPNKPTSPPSVSCDRPVNHCAHSRVPTACTIPAPHTKTAAFPCWDFGAPWHKHQMDQAMLLVFLLLAAAVTGRIGEVIENKTTTTNTTTAATAFRMGAQMAVDAFRAVYVVVAHTV